MVGVVALNGKFTARFIFSVLGVLSFYLVYAIFGVGNYEEGGEALVKRVLIFSIPSVLVLYLGSRNRDSDVIFFSLFNLLFAYSVVLYSYLSGYYGYGELKNPFVGEVANSPSYVILIVLSTVVLCEKLRLELSYKRCALVVLLLFIAFLSCSIYMQSRFSVLALAAYVPIFFRGNIKPFPLALAILFISILYMNIDLSGMTDLLHRLNESGLESPRWVMIRYGLSEMFNEPFGGMRAANAGSGYQGAWFHNVYLDIARVAGLPALTYWMVMQAAFLGIAFYRLSPKDYGFYLVVFIFLTMSLSQNLGFDGFYNYILYYFYIYGLAVSSEIQNGV